jgi:hypothetical protein
LKATAKNKTGLSFLPRNKVRDKLQQESRVSCENRNPVLYVSGSLLSQGRRLDSRFHACALKRYGAQARE